MQKSLIVEVREVKKRNARGYSPERYQKNKDKIKEYRQNHKNEIKLKKAEYYQSHKDEVKLQSLEYYQTHKDERKEYYHNHKDEIKLQRVEHYQQNKNEINAKYRNKKIELIQAIGNKCQGDNCSIEYDRTNGAIFQSHHISPYTKLFHLSGYNLIHHTWNEVLDEASKCRLLCANCHSLEHTIDEPRSPQTIKYRNIKIKLIQLKGNKCQGDNCNIEYNETNSALFQFHHINLGDKLFELNGGNLLNYSWNELLDEAKKCKLLCANCHSKIHSEKY